MIQCCSFTNLETLCPKVQGGKYWLKNGLDFRSFQQCVQLFAKCWWLYTAQLLATGYNLKCINAQLLFGNCWLVTVSFGCWTVGRSAKRSSCCELPIGGLHDLLLDLSLTATTVIVMRKMNYKTITMRRMNYMTMSNAFSLHPFLVSYQHGAKNF